MLIKQSQATCGLVLQGGPEEAVITVIAGGKQSASFEMMTSAPGYSLLPIVDNCPYLDGVCPDGR